MERSLNRDTLHTAKVGVVYTHVNDGDLSSNWFIKGSSELSTNHYDIFFLKNKFFMRYIFPIRNLEL